MEDLKTSFNTSSITGADNLLRAVGVYNSSPTAGQKRISLARERDQPNKKILGITGQTKSFRGPYVVHAWSDG